MTDLIKDLETAPSGSRELSDRVLLACGWRRQRPMEGAVSWVWFRPDGEKHNGKSPDPTRNLQDAVDWVVPEGVEWRVQMALGTKSQPEIGFAIVGECGRTGSTPALALCIAALRAKEERNE